MVYSSCCGRHWKHSIRIIRSWLNSCPRLLLSRSFLIIYRQYFSQLFFFRLDMIFSQRGLRRFQSSRINAVWLCLLPTSTGLLLGSLFGHEDGGDMFIRNIGWFSPGYMLLYHRRLTSPMSSLSTKEGPKTETRLLLNILWHDAWKPEYRSQNRWPLLRNGSVNRLQAAMEVLLSYNDGDGVLCWIRSGLYNENQRPTEESELRKSLEMAVND
jgi:hypothetical protein